MKKALICTLILVIIRVLVFGIYGDMETATASAETTPKYGGTLRHVCQSPGAAIGYPPEFMPNNAHWTAAVWAECLMRQLLNGEIVPWLAESYEIADDYMSVTLTLRQGVKFHDGSDFNAEAVKWNLDCLIEAKQEPFWTSVDAVDDYHVRINFSAYKNYLIDDLIGKFMVSKAAFDANGLDYVRANPVGTGPFKFVSYKRDVSCTFVRNDDYWGKDDQGNQLPYMDGVEVLYMSDTMTQIASAQAGEVDMLLVSPNKTAADLQDLGLTVKMYLKDTDILMADTLNKNSPWANQMVREAAEYAIDREAIAKAFCYGFTEAPYQLPGPACPAFNPNFTLGRYYDVEKAKQLMKDAGYEKGFDTAIIGGFHYNKDIVAAIQAYLAKIGIRAEIKVPEMSSFAADYIFGTWNNALLYTGMPGGVNVNSIWNGILYSPEYLGFQSWERTQEYLEALDASMAAPIADLDLMRAISDVITKQASIIPIIQSGLGVAYQTYVMNLDAETLGQTKDWLPEQTWLDK